MHLRIMIYTYWMPLR